MKRIFSLILSLALLTGCLPIGAGAEELFLDVYCEQQDFSTKYAPNYTAEWEEGNGLRIWLDGKGYVPNVLIFRRPLDKKINDPVNYLNNVYREYMEEKYGDSVGTIPCQTMEVGDKTVYAVRYLYEANGNRLCLARIIEVREGGDVEFAAKYPVDEAGEALAALYVAVLYYTAGQRGKTAQPAEMGGVYHLRFEMNEEAILLVRMPSTQGFNAFNLRTLADGNQIWVCPEDYSFVVDYVKSRIPEKAAVR